MTHKHRTGKRDLRLDFFRGLVLFLIFFDHIPGNVFSYATLGAFAFCDAAEVFIFISGYTVALVYGRGLLKRGPVYAAAQIYHRVWQLYVAHIFLFVIFVAEVSYSAIQLHNPIYSDEMMIGTFLQDPAAAIGNALLLRFQPTFLDILPLYIVLLGMFPIAVLAIKRSAWLAGVPSALLYGLTLTLGLSVRGFPHEHVWYFNPLSWQFLFVIGSLCGFGRLIHHRVLPASRWIMPMAATIVALSALVKLSWTAHGLYPWVPDLLANPLWPTSADKTNLSPVRLINFLALAIVVDRLVRRDHPFFASRWAAPMVRCGQHSLHVFCLSILLSALGHFALMEIDGGLPLQLLINGIGVGGLFGLARLMVWYKDVSRAPERSRASATAASRFSGIGEAQLSSAAVPSGRGPCVSPLTT